MNTVAYSAGRVCYPTKNDARAGERREYGTWQGGAWWPQPLPSREWHPRTVGVASVAWKVLTALCTPSPDTRRDYMPVQGP